MSLLRIDETGAPIDAFADALAPLDDTEAMARAMADTAAELVRSTFTATRSPDGVAWRPLARPRPGIGGALLLTGELRDLASDPAVDLEGFTFSVTGPKGVHQHGSRKRGLPARPFLPDGANLPATWEQELDAALLRALSRALGDPP